MARWLLSRPQTLVVPHRLLTTNRCPEKGTPVYFTMCRPEACVDVARPVFSITRLEYLVSIFVYCEAQGNANKGTARAARWPCWISVPVHMFLDAIEISATITSRNDLVGVHTRTLHPKISRSVEASQKIASRTRIAYTCNLYRQRGSSPPLRSSRQPPVSGRI